MADLGKAGVLEINLVNGLSIVHVSLSKQCVNSTDDRTS